MGVLGAHGGAARHGGQASALLLCSSWVALCWGKAGRLKDLGFSAPPVPAVRRCRGTAAGAPRRRHRATRVVVSKALAELSMVSAYITTDVGVFTWTDKAGHGFARPVLMCISGMASFLVGTGWCWLQDGRAGALQAVNPRGWLRLLPVSVMFSLGTLCTLHAVTLLSPVSVKVLFQLKLPLTVALSRILLGSRYNGKQLWSLFCIFVFVTLFTLLRIDAPVNDMFAGGLGGLSSVGIGFLCTLAAVTLNVLGSLVGEQALKTGAPFYRIVAHVKLGEMLLSFLIACVLPGAALPLSTLRQDPSAAFRGFNDTVWTLAAFLVADAYMSALVVKRMNSVVKALAKCLSLVALYLVSLLIRGTEVFFPLQVALAALVVVVTLKYTYDTVEVEKRKGQEGGGE